MKKSKKSLIKGLSIGALSLVLVATVGTVFATSYSEWKNYYETMIKEKEQYEKEHAPEVTTMNGISVKIKDGVGFYKNGKASAIKSNFVVEGLYTIGNEVNKRDYVEELSPTDYTIEAPEDFTENGGDVTFHYLKQEPELDENGEEKKDEEGNTILKTIYDFTETLSINLEDVKPSKISIVENPYLVVYAEGDRFNREGLVADIINNDGSVYAKSVALSLLNFPKTRLTAETASVQVTYKFGEGEEDIAYGEIPVKVLPIDEFSNGELQSLEVKSDGIIQAGESLNAFKPIVYGYYSSGNRVLLDEGSYKLSGITGAAEFGNSYFVKVTSIENPNVSSRVQLKTIKDVSSDSATVSGATKYDGYVKDFDNNDYIEFTYDSAQDEAVNFALSMSNGYVEFNNNKFLTRTIDFNDFAYVSINEIIRETSYSFNGGQAFDYLSDAFGDFEKVNLGTFKINAGANKIRVTFKESNTKKASAFGAYVAGAISELEVTPSSSTQQFTSFGETIKANKEAGVASTFDVTKNVDWSNDLQWTYASCTDGEYAYLYSRVNNQTPVSIIKYDLKTNQIVAQSASFTLLNEKHTPLFIKGGYVYALNSDGYFYRLSTSFTGKKTAKLECLPNMKFENIKDNTTIKSAYYDEQNRKFVVLTDSALATYDTNFKLLATFSSYSSSAFRISGDESYVYVLMNSSGGSISPSVRLYDYEGKLVDTIVIPNTIETMGVTEAVMKGSNIQSLFSLNGNLYFTMLRWSGGNNSSVYKAAIKGQSVAPASKERMDLYEYISKCASKGEGVTPKFETSAFSSSIVSSKLDQYAHGICSDGKNIYVSTNSSNSADPTGSIKKFDLATGAYAGETTAFKRTSTWANGDYLMYKDGYVYLFGTDIVRRVNVEAITLDNKPEFEENPLTIEGISTMNSGAYNATVNKMAIVSGSKLNIVGGTSLSVEKSVSITSGALGVAADPNYIYVFYEEKAVGVSAKFSVFDWSGNKLKDGQVLATLDESITDANNNIQGMTIVDGECYFFVSQWTRRSKVLKATFDTSIL